MSMETFLMRVDDSVWNLQTKHMLIIYKRKITRVGIERKVISERQWTLPHERAKIHLIIRLGIVQDEYTL